MFSKRSIPATIQSRRHLSTPLSSPTSDPYLPPTETSRPLSPSSPNHASASPLPLYPSPPHQQPNHENLCTTPMALNLTPTSRNPRRNLHTPLDTNLRPLRILCDAFSPQQSHLSNGESEEDGRSTHAVFIIDLYQVAA